MSGDWEILGIDPTDDPAQIRRAYSRALRIHRPDTDPKGFQRLREAYERCSEPSYVPSAPPKLDPTADLLEMAAPPPPRTETPPAPAPPEPPRPSPLAVTPEILDDPSLLLAWDTLWSDPSKRWDRRAWERFLTGDHWWNLDARHAVEDQILSDMESDWSRMENRAIHNDAKFLLDRHFGWWKRDQELYERFLAGFVDDLLICAQRGGLRNGSEDYPTAPRAPLLKGPGDATSGSDTGGSSGESILSKIGWWRGLVLLMVLIRACSYLGSDAHSSPTRPAPPVLPPKQWYSGSVDRPIPGYSETGPAAGNAR